MQKIVKSLSLWAVLNPIKSQGILVLCHLLLAALSIYCGVWLFAHDVILPPYVYYVGMTLFFVGLSFYPIRRARYKIWKYGFAKQKLMDLTIILSFVLVVISTSNTDSNAAWRENSTEYKAMKVVLKANGPAAEIAHQDKWSRKEIRHTLRSNFKSFVSEMKNNRGESSAQNWQIFFVILIMLLLMFLMAGLSCSLACNGSEAAALILLLTSWSLIIYVVVLSIRKIKGKKENRYSPN